jgi:SAM-dependent methyltransferase
MKEAALTPRDFARLRDHLHDGIAGDAAFDVLYPALLRAASDLFWTPVVVASAAAWLLARYGARRVLDVGSGAGKFCLVAACVRPDIHFTGVEQRPHLVAAATAIAGRLGLDNVRFHIGDVTAFPWRDFDGLYLYNPFEENNCTTDGHLDHTVELSTPRFMADAGRVAAALAAAPSGMRMVTYHGFGGPIPLSWKLVHAELACSGWLRVWVKHRPGGDLRTFYVEYGDQVVLIDRESRCIHPVASHPLQESRRWHFAQIFNRSAGPTRPSTRKEET